MCICMYICVYTHTERDRVRERQKQRGRETPMWENRKSECVLFGVCAERERECANMANVN